MRPFGPFQIVDNSVENSFYNLNIVSSKSIERFCALAHPNAADFNSLEEKDKINSFRQYLQVHARKTIRERKYQF